MRGIADGWREDQFCDLIGPGMAQGATDPWHAQWPTYGSRIAFVSQPVDRTFICVAKQME